jgi:ABC-type transport system involved in Fe-S cluster assembly fused permease/ATPase subunit
MLLKLSTLLWPLSVTANRVTSYPHSLATPSMSSSSNLFFITLLDAEGSLIFKEGRKIVMTTGYRSLSETLTTLESFAGEDSALSDLHIPLPQHI